MQCLEPSEQLKIRHKIREKAASKITSSFIAHKEKVNNQQADILGNKVFIYQSNSKKIKEDSERYIKRKETPHDTRLK